MFFPRQVNADDNEVMSFERLHEIGECFNEESTINLSNHVSIIIFPM